MKEVKKQTTAKLPTFREWYELKYGTRMPLYLESSVKKTLQAEYEKVIANIQN